MPKERKTWGGHLESKVPSLRHAPQAPPVFAVSACAFLAHERSLTFRPPAQLVALPARRGPAALEDQRDPQTQPRLHSTSMQVKEISRLLPRVLGEEAEELLSPMGGLGKLPKARRTVSHRHIPALLKGLVLRSTNSDSPETC